MQDKYLLELAQTILTLKDNKSVIDFLEGILTPKELLEIKQRFQIVKLLKHGVTQRQIAEKLGVGIATITRGSKEIQKGKFKNV